MDRIFSETKTRKPQQNLGVFQNIRENWNVERFEEKPWSSTVITFVLWNLKTPIKQCKFIHFYPKSIGRTPECLWKKIGILLHLSSKIYLHDIPQNIKRCQEIFSKTVPRSCKVVSFKKKRNAADSYEVSVWLTKTTPNKIALGRKEYRGLVKKNNIF